MFSKICNRPLGLFKKTYFLISIASQGFFRCITPKNDIDQFSQKNFRVKGMCNSILAYDIIKISKFFFSQNTGK